VTETLDPEVDEPETCDHRDAYGSTIILGENPATPPVCIPCDQRFPKWPFIEVLSGGRR